MMALPLADASRRLRRPPGRPKKDRSGDSVPAQARQGSVLAAIFEGRPQAPLALAPPERPGITARRLYSRRQAADYLSCSTDTIDRWVARGLLPKLRLPYSRLVRFDCGDLDALVPRG